MAKAQRGKSPVVYPKKQAILSILGENIKLARKRRSLSQSMVAERADTTRLTVSNIEKGEPSVAIGHYINVLGVLGLENDLSDVGSNDMLGHKLRDIELMKSSSRPPAKGKRS